MTNNMNRYSIYFIASLLMFVFSAGCFQGRPSDKPPIHLNPNMDNQEKYRPQAESNFFADGATMQTPVEGTVARGQLRADTEYYTGKTDGGDFITTLPVNVELNKALLLRGYERYDIFCSPCHGQIGDGRGIIVERGMLPPPSFHTDSIRTFTDGRIYDVIANGVRNMPAYRFQIPVSDRWAIVAYLRALQRSQNAQIEDLPDNVKDKL